MTYPVIQLEERHYIAAEEAARRLPVYKGSHRGVEANVIGCLGEIVFTEFLVSNGVGYTGDYATTHDLTIVRSGRLDIKTKDRTVPPRGDYEASVPLYNHEHQDVAYWGFVSLHRNRNLSSRFVESFHHAYLVGVANRSILDRHGKIWRAGQVDPSNGTKFWTDCINLSLNALKPMLDATTIWRERQV